MSKQAWMGLVVLAALPLVAGVALADAYVPVSTPALGTSATLPGGSTPATPTLDVHTPSVTMPGPCTFSFCSEETVLPGGTFATPAVEAQALETEPVGIGRTCAPANVACTNGFTVPGQSAGSTPYVPSNEAGLPDVSAPAACSLANDLCDASYTFEGTGFYMPAAPPRPLTPEVTLGFALPAIEGAVPLAPPLSLGEHAPIPVTVPAPVVGDVAIVLCESGCPSPESAAPIGFYGPLSLYVLAGAEGVALQPL